MIKRSAALLLTLMCTLAQATTPINVVSGAVQSINVNDEVQTFGTLVAVNRVTISPEVSGKIASIFFEDGQSVKKGALILQIDNTEAKASLFSAQANLELSRRDYQRYEELNKYGGTTKQKLDQQRADVNAKDAVVQADVNALQKYTLMAPFAGRLGSFTVNTGDYVTPGQALVSLVNDNPLKVEYALPEDTFAKLRIGQVTLIDVSALQGKVFSAHVSYIAPAIDAKTGTISVQAMLKNPDGVLSPGMFVHIRQLFSSEKVLAVPEQAILASPEGSYVYVIQGNTAIKRNITVAGYHNDLAKVSKGLAEGEHIVVEGQQKLSDHQEITVIRSLTKNS